MDEKTGQNPGKRAFRYLKVAISLTFGVFLLWLIGRGQDFGMIFREVREANYFYIILAAIFAAISHLIRAIRWNVLVNSLGYNANTWQSFNAVMTGYLSNLAVPRLGEITRCVMLGRLTKAPVNALFGTVVAERVFDMVCLMAIIALTIAFQFEFLKSFLYQFFVNPLLIKETSGWWYLMALVLLAIIILIAALLFLKHKLSSPAAGGFYYKLKRQAKGLKNGMLTIWTIKRKFQFIFYSVIIWICYMLTVYFCFFAIQATAHLSIQAAITLLAVGSLGIVAPVPGGIGTYHFLTILSLTELYGIVSESASSFAYISHAIQTLVIIIAGTTAWFLISLQKKNGNLNTV
jgi:glycosyltransferase 2 family protein